MVLMAILEVAKLRTKASNIMVPCQRHHETSTNADETLFAIDLVDASQCPVLDAKRIDPPGTFSLRASLTTTRMPLLEPSS